MDAVDCFSARRAPLRGHSLGVLLGPEGGELVAVVVGHHGGLAGLPAGGAHLTVLVRVLEGLHHAENLVDVAADGQIVDGVLAEDTLAVDDVSGAESDTSITGGLEKAAVVAGDGLLDISDHRDLHGAEATLLSGLHGVLSVGELRVDRAANKLAVDGLELAGLVAELADLSGAHEGKIEGPEEKHDIFASELFQGDLLKSVLPPGLSGECGGRLTDEGLLSRFNHLDSLSSFKDY